MTNLLINILFILLASSICFSANIIHAEENDHPIQSSIDALEIQLELDRHTRLIQTRLHKDSKLNEFTTDGCSGGLSVGWEYFSKKIDRFEQTHGSKPPWESCCISHDHAYHTGALETTDAQESFNARKNADNQLKECVQSIGNDRKDILSEEYGISTDEVEHLYSAISSLMYRAVRIGGMPCTGLPWRWGYGWPECQ